MGHLSSACKLAREHISLHLDGELSEFEQVALDAHLQGCARCRTYDASVAEVSGRLRSAPLEQPQFPVVLPHRSRLRVPLRTAQVAAAAAVVAVVGFAVADVTPGRDQSVFLTPGDTRADRGPNLTLTKAAHATIGFRVERSTAPRPIRGGAKII